MKVLVVVHEFADYVKGEVIKAEKESRRFLARIMPSMSWSLTILPSLPPIQHRPRRQLPKLLPRPHLPSSRGKLAPATTHSHLRVAFFMPAFWRTE